MDPTDDLSPIEKEWQGMQVWLKSCGYMLRPRFRADWIPSWITDPPPAGEGPWAREDWLSSNVQPVIDAIRMDDNKPVMLKKVYRPRSRKDDEEEDIAVYLSSPELLNDPRNHAIPIYDVLQIPNNNQYDLLVMPLLRPFDSPRFDTIGECMDFFRQIFQGLQFLHHHHIAHRDCTGLNAMMDASEMYPKGFHPQRQDRNVEFKGPAEQRYTRTQQPPKYYWIDFGLSARFPPGTQSYRIPILRGNDKTVPEHQDPRYMRQLCDPFPTDIYYLGNLVREFFTEGNREFDFSQKIGLDFIKPLVGDMVQDDPTKRPTIDECVSRLDEIISAQSSWMLRSQVWHNSDNIFGFLYRLFPHWARRIIYIITQTPPIPQRK